MDSRRATTGGSPDRGGRAFVALKILVGAGARGGQDHVVRAVSRSQAAHRGVETEAGRGVDPTTAGGREQEPHDRRDWNFAGITIRDGLDLYVRHPARTVSFCGKSLAEGAWGAVLVLADTLRWARLLPGGWTLRAARPS